MRKNVFWLLDRNQTGDPVWVKNKISGEYVKRNVLLILIFILLFVLGCVSSNTNKVSRVKANTSILLAKELDGKWKIVDFRLNKISGMDDDQAKNNIGTFGTIQKGVFVIKLSGIDSDLFKTKLDTSPVFIDRGKSPFYNQNLKNALQPSDFDFSDKVYVYEGYSIDDLPNLVDITVNEEKKKMIVGYEGVKFLLVRQDQ